MTLARRALAVLPLLLLVVGTGEAAALRGRLIGPDGAPVVGAEVTVAAAPGAAEPAHAATTDEDGAFVLGVVPAPPFELIVTGHAAVALRRVVVAEIPAEGEVAVLRVEDAFGEEVTVVSGAPRSVETAPAAAATLIGRGDLEQRAPGRLADAVATIPGAGRLEDGPSAVPSLRGLARGRTLVLLDGARVSTERRAGPSATYLDPDTAEEIEVVRGPGSVAFGTDALGGVIHVTSRLPRPDEPGTLLWRATGATGGGPYAAGLDYNAGLGSGALLVGASVRSSDDYSSPDGVVPNSSSEERGARAAYVGPLGAGTLSATARLDQGRDIEKPASNVDQVRAYYPEEDSLRLGASYGGRGYSAALSWDRYRLVTDREDLTLGTTSRADVDAQDIGARLTTERNAGGVRLFGGLDASARLGLNAVVEDFVGDAVVARGESIEDADRTSAGLFAGASGRPGRFRLSAGARGDYIVAENSGGDAGDQRDDYWGVAGFGAAGIELLPGLEVHVQVSRGFRDPTLSDRYFTGPTGRGVVVGNPTLEPEASLQTDVALRYQHGALRSALYGYRYRIDDLIQRVFLDDTGATDVYTYANGGRAVLRGLELEGAWAFPQHVSLEWAAQVALGSLEDGTATDDIPPPSVSLTVRRAPGARTWWFVRGVAVDRDGDPGPSEVEVPGYALLDAAAGLRLGAGIEAELQARNIFDHAYRATADSRGVLAPGRTFQLTLRGRL